MRVMENHVSLLPLNRNDHRGILFILSTLYRFITIEYVVGYTASVSILVTLMFYQQLKKALKRDAQNVAKNLG